MSFTFGQVCKSLARDAKAETVQFAAWAFARRSALLRAFAGAALVLGGAAAAVSNLAPTASEVPVREISETLGEGVLTQQALATQAQQLRDHAFTLYRSEATRSSDSMETLLSRLGVRDAAAAAFLRTDTTARSSILGRVGRMVHVQVNEANALQKLTVRWINGDDDQNFQRLLVARIPATGAGDTGLFTARVEQAPLVATQRLSGGVIRFSLFAATDEARIPDSVATQIAEIFSGDIDFHRALRKGDRFSVVYEALEADGEPLRSGRVLSAEFVNQNKPFSAVWFQEATASKGHYFNFDGQSLRKAYLASPLEFSRVTSGFSSRLHPIFKTWRKHLGVDYAAPTGTPIRAVGDAVVEFAGVQNGYGNVVVLKHRSNHTTLYAHMSKIFVRQGQTVEQGSNIGAVGSTGWSTGPHLHFEFRVAGEHRDPLEIAKQSEAVSVSTAALPQFRVLAAAQRRDLSAAATISAIATQ